MASFDGLARSQPMCKMKELYKRQKKEKKIINMFASKFLSAIRCFSVF